MNRHSRRLLEETPEFPILELGWYNLSESKLWKPTGGIQTLQELLGEPVWLDGGLLMESTEAFMNRLNSLQAL